MNWSTATELNFDYFSIERSEDGLIFSEIAQVKGHGTTKMNAMIIHLMIYFHLLVNHITD
ncbi:MAG: hypothetical protein U5K54_00810 [Cytophagales bacterium]|nr:hypothetical protein [Cytophagales bacterium]